MSQSTTQQGPTGRQAGVARETILEIRDLTKSFGGLVAVDSVSLRFEAGLLHAVIGPNGAGKTTLFNLISGLLPADGGSATFRGIPILGRKTHDIVRLGIVRTLQVKTVFNGLTVFENLQAAAQARTGYLSPFIMTRTDQASREVAETILDEMRLGPIARQQAGTLSYGDVALLEIGMAMALEPRLLLLDEPTCGMSPAETERTAAKILDLSQRTEIILIEHDMEVVFQIADLVTVMAQGRVLARGTPDEVAGNPDVREAYLGPED